jgi:hypothetical protein
MRDGGLALKTAKFLLIGLAGVWAMGASGCGSTCPKGDGPEVSKVSAPVTALVAPFALGTYEIRQYAPPPDPADPNAPAPDTEAVVGYGCLFNENGTAVQLWHLQSGKQSAPKQQYDPRKGLVYRRTGTSCNKAAWIDDRNKTSNHVVNDTRLCSPALNAACASIVSTCNGMREIDDGPGLLVQNNGNGSYKLVGALHVALAGCLRTESWSNTARAQVVDDNSTDVAILPGHEVDNVAMTNSVYTHVRTLLNIGAAPTVIAYKQSDCPAAGACF